MKKEEKREELEEQGGVEGAGMSWESRKESKEQRGVGGAGRRNL